MRFDPTLRPTYQVPIPLDRSKAVERLRTAFERRPDFENRWKGKGRWVELYVPESERRPWSPYLSVRVDEEGDGSSLFARFAPHPEVWTLFVFVYGLVGTAGLFGGVLGYVQWASGAEPWGFWSVGTGVLLLGALHGISRIGRHLGRSQMVRLQGELGSVLADLVVDGADARE